VNWDTHSYMSFRLTKYTPLHPASSGHGYSVSVDGYSLSWQNRCLCGVLGEMQHKGHLSVRQEVTDTDGPHVAASGHLPLNWELA